MMYKFLAYHVVDYMHREPAFVAPGMTLKELQALFEAKDFNALPVVDGGRVVGFVTKLDFLKAFTFNTEHPVPNYDQVMRRTVADVMTRAIVTVEPEAPLTRVLQLMVELRARSFPVVDASGALAGIISRGDIMRALKDATQA